MNNLKSLFSLVLVLLSFNSCVDQISFPLDKGVAKLIVSGQISNLDEDQYVFISETTSADREPLYTGQYYVLNDLPRPVTSAMVYLVNEREEKILLNMSEDGKYKLDRSYKLEDEVYYNLEILVDGNEYRTEPQKMPDAVGEDELRYEFQRGEFKGSLETAFVSIYSDSKLPDSEEPYYLRWDVDEAYYWDLTFFPNPFNNPPPDCYVFGFPDPERITLFNGENVDSEQKSSVQLVAERKVDESFLSRHYFNVRQVSTSKESYEYWRKVRELVNNSGSVFDSPPAPIKGNIFNTQSPEEVVLGYFEIARVSQSRIYTVPSDVSFVVEAVCTYDPARPIDDYPKTCLRCSEFPSSTNNTPHWWFDQ